MFAHTIQNLADYDIARRVDHLNELRQLSCGRNDIVVAILDGSVDWRAPTFNHIRLKNSDSPGSTSSPSSQHSAHVASIIFGDAKGRIAGFAANCRAFAVEVFANLPNMKPTASQVKLAFAIKTAKAYACEHKAKALIMNLSGGQIGMRESIHPLLEDAINSLDPETDLLIAAAGNEGCDCVHLPAVHERVLAVGAADDMGKPLLTSNWGRRYNRNGILALGDLIPGIGENGQVVFGSGTSFATPIVTGVVAVLASIQLDTSGFCNTSYIKESLLATALPCRTNHNNGNSRCLRGLINVRESLLRIFPGGRNVNAGPLSSQQSDSSEQKPEKTNILSTTAEGLGIEPSCGGNTCSCGKQAVVVAETKVFAVGKLGFDYGNRSRRAYFENAMRKSPPEVGLSNPPNIESAADLTKYLTQRAVTGESEAQPQYLIQNGPLFAHRGDVETIIWLLEVDETPLYAIRPTGTASLDIYDTLVSFLRDQMPVAEGGQDAERVSVAGIVSGNIRLYSGEVVPVLVPDHRGLFNWSKAVLLDAIQKMSDGSRQVETQLEEFLTRVYDQTRNLGITSQERAVNYAATDALFVQGIFSQSAEDVAFSGMELDTLSVNKSPICREDFDCWDVNIVFYDPNNLNRARRGIRYTVDVSDVVPIILPNSRKAYSLR